MTKRVFFFLYLLFAQCLLAIDFDCVFVGSSPIPLFEAIYQRRLGKNVLILEQTGQCGGAWQTIDVCGMPHVDLGCHQIGHDLTIKAFLEVYGGCRIVSMDKPYDANAPMTQNGFYFSQGCHELIRNLSHLLAIEGVPLWFHHRLESVYVDVAAGHIVLTTAGKRLTAGKIFYTSTSTFQIENAPSSHPTATTHYVHLYLLIQDPTSPKFSYINHPTSGIARAMNLTHFTDLAHTGRQLLVLQLHHKQINSSSEQDYLSLLKKQHLVDPSAYLLQVEFYTYTASHAPHKQLAPEWRPYFEVLHAANFSDISRYIPKWQQILTPYREIGSH